MSDKKLILGEKYWVLRFTMTWVWDYTKREHLFLPRLYKIQQVEIGEMVEVKQNQWNRNANTIFVFRLLKATKNRYNTGQFIEINHPVGDYQPDKPARWNFNYNRYQRSFFFKTKREAMEKLIAMKPDIEKFVTMQVEAYREATMKKIGKMNQVMAKLEAMEKGLKK